MSGNANDAKIYAYLGSSGSGKTTRARKKIQKPKRQRTMIWSPKEEIDNYASYYAGTVICTNAAEILNVLKTAGKKPFHLVVKPKLIREQDEKLFHTFCVYALAIAKHTGDVTVMVDELHTVTRFNWAPDGWSKLVMMGRGYGCEIVAMSQRPASMDKNFLGNTSIINCGRLSYPEDAKAVAKSLGVKPDEVQALNGFMWIERDNLTGKTTRS